MAHAVIPPPKESAQKDPKGSGMTEEIRQGIMTSAPKPIQDDLDKVELACMRVFFDKASHQTMMENVDKIEGGDAAVLAQSSAAMVTMIKDKWGKNTFPFQAMIPASVLVMTHIYDFLCEAGRMEETPQLIAEATLELTGLMMKKMNIGPEQIQGARKVTGGIELRKNTQGMQGGVSPSVRQGPPQQPPMGILNGNP